MYVKRYPPSGFPERLHEAYIASGLSVKEIGKRAGLSHQSIYGYMFNGVEPNTSALVKLCVVLKVSADWLLFGKK